MLVRRKRLVHPSVRWFLTCLGSGLGSVWAEDYAEAGAAPGHRETDPAPRDTLILMIQLPIHLGGNSGAKRRGREQGHGMSGKGSGSPLQSSFMFLG